MSGLSGRGRYAYTGRCSWVRGVDGEGDCRNSKIRGVGRGGWVLAQRGALRLWRGSDAAEMGFAKQNFAKAGIEGDRTKINYFVLCLQYVKSYTMINITDIKPTTNALDIHFTISPRQGDTLQDVLDLAIKASEGIASQANSITDQKTYRIPGRVNMGIVNGTYIITFKS